MNIMVHKSLKVSDFVFFRKIPRSGIIGSCDNSMFSFLRKLTILHHSCTNLHYHQQWKFSFISLSTLVISCLWDDSHSDRCEVNLLVILICTSLVMRCWTSLHVPVGHLYVFFGKMLIQALFLFFYSACLVLWYWGHVIYKYCLRFHFIYDFLLMCKFF